MSPLHENYIELHIFSKTSNVRNVIKVNLLKSFCNSCKKKKKKKSNNNNKTQIILKIIFSLGIIFSSNHFDNILRLLNILRSFPFTASEVKRDYH